MSNPKLKKTDEWGDEGTWDTVIDFTKIKKGGVPVDTFAIEMYSEERLAEFKKNNEEALKNVKKIISDSSIVQ